jgi:hypothetical protein
LPPFKGLKKNGVAGLPAVDGLLIFLEEGSYLGIGGAQSAKLRGRD